jgi:hypothetical protein
MRATALAALLLTAATAHAQQDPCDACREPPATPPVDDLNGPVVVLDPPVIVAPPAKPRPNVLFRYELGGVYSHFFGRHFGGARLDFDLGVDLPHVSVGGRAGAEVGGSQSGLPYERLSWGFGVDGKLGPVRLGIEPRIGAMLITRASEPNPFENLVAFSLGIHGELVVALIGAGQPSQRSHSGLDLIVRAGYDWVDHDHGTYHALDGLVLKIGLGGRF